MIIAHALATTGSEFQAPDSGIFEWGPLFPDGPPWLRWLTKPVLLVGLAAALVIGFFQAALRRPVLVPGALQSAAELAYLFVRDQIARPTIGKDGDRFMPFLMSVFFSAVAYWFLSEKLTPAGVGVGLLGLVMTVVLTAFEIFVQALQAYIFTLLAASYIDGALHPDH
ncbi:F0F1 ATP synthase subunit A [Spirillospora sp. CA-255316]